MIRRRNKIIQLLIQLFVFGSYWECFSKMVNVSRSLRSTFLVAPTDPLATVFEAWELQEVTDDGLLFLSRFLSRLITLFSIRYFIFSHIFSSFLCSNHLCPFPIIFHANTATLRPSHILLHLFLIRSSLVAPHINLKFF